MSLCITAPFYGVSSTFGFLTGRDVLEFILYMGFVHIWVGALKKQLKSEPIRRKAVYIVVSVAILLILLSELGVSMYYKDYQFRIASMIINIFGALSGVMTFKLLYRRCC